MIIFGTKARQKTVGAGQFYCPRCQVQRAYERKKARRYFTLYFIPVIPMDELGEFVECQTCHMAFTPDVLSMKPAPRKLTVTEMLNTVKKLLEVDAMPVEYLVRDLTAAGLDREVALATIRDQIGDGRKTCPNCGLTYAPAVTTCSECQQPLENHAQ